MQLTSTQAVLPPIDGRPVAPYSTHEIEALAEFYRAFNYRNMQLMEQNWWDSDEVSMTRPHGEIIRGLPNIMAVFSRLFATVERTQLGMRDYTIHIVGSVFYAIGMERGTVDSNSQETAFEMYSTRIFRLEMSRWRQTHSHISLAWSDESQAVIPF